MNDLFQKRRAFTLIELLVVVSILALLVSILLPAMARARAQSKQVVCRSNLRNIWTGVWMFALEHEDRAPYLEDWPASDDPFDPDHTTGAGTVLKSYVAQGSWVCPSAVDGLPINGGPGSWTLTYHFRTAGPHGDKDTRHYDDAARGYAMGHPLHPAISNYAQLDGRPVRLLNGRRYTSGASSVSNYEPAYDKWWAGRWALVRDRFAGEPSGRFVTGPFDPRYPHRGRLEKRTDLQNYRTYYEQITNYRQRDTGYLGLFADGPKVQIFLTRYPQQHQEGS